MQTSVADAELAVRSVDLKQHRFRKKIQVQALQGWHTCHAWCRSFSSLATGSALRCRFQTHKYIVHVQACVFLQHVGTTLLHLPPPKRS